MGKQYIYNTGTGVLHIKNYCHHSKGCLDDRIYKFFSSENDAVAYSNGSLRMCKLCSKERDKLIEKNPLKL
ncbi:hypothetical protein [Huintestinicola sp.]|uniref:hypothetical protein n=1 Tax=Huintestinicola sp. TaxID=2981661 RepID=UPI003D7DFD73